jgi:hypothetical protein
MKKLFYAVPLTVLMAAGQAVAEQNQVRLLYAKSDDPVSGQTEVCAHTRAGGTVNLHWNDGSPNWSDQSMTLWSCAGDHCRYCTTFPNSGVEFALHYTGSGGIDEWDNNNGADYQVPPSHVGGYVGLDYAWIDGSCNPTLYVTVENLSYNKEVGVHYSLDGGPWQTLAGQFLDMCNNSNCETWEIRPPGGCGKQLKFAVYYENKDWGTTYWDNNFKQDYTMTLGPWSTKY